MTQPVIRGRLAPTPTGYLHLGHYATFREARRRAGHLVLRIEDLDSARCRPEFVEACLQDLQAAGLTWEEGPVFQTKRREQYLAAWQHLRDGGFIYPCSRSRKDVASAVTAPHEEEPVFPAAWRTPVDAALAYQDPRGVNWRFRVPDGEAITFSDGRLGACTYIAGQDFGDFLVWRRDNLPAYELAVVVDDLWSQIDEVVRGEDLLVSTARQLLLYRAFLAPPPAFYHTPLLRDAEGHRLAKRSSALALRNLLNSGVPLDLLVQAAWTK